jgi:thiamine kinase-like enzyme
MLRKFPSYVFSVKELVVYPGKHIESWQECNTEDTTLKNLSGLSNFTYLVTTTNERASPKQVIFRSFDNQIIDAEQERIVFSTLSEQKNGPHLYFQNEVYRIE